MQILVEELTQTAFADFGFVLGEPLVKNPDIQDAVSDVWLGISDLLGIGASPGRQVTYLKIHSNPPLYDKIEKHETSAEVFVPLEGQSIMLVLSAKAVDGNGNPDMRQARAFFMDGSQAVLLRRGTWHAVPYKLTGVATYLVLVDDAIIEKQDLHVTPVEPVEFIFSTSSLHRN